MATYTVTAARTTAVIANAPANGTTVDLSSAVGGSPATVLIAYTQGSLTDATFTVQVSSNSTDWYNLTSYEATSDAVSVTLTTSENVAIPIPTSARYVRVNTASTGTTTSSDAIIGVSFVETDSVSRVNGGLQIS